MGRNDLTVERIVVLGAQADALIAAANAEGFPFMERLKQEWMDGINRFDLPGEALFAARMDGRLAGIGGLCRDPYTADGSIGRVRHLYTLPDSRRQGVGRAIMERIVALAAANFSMLRLRTTTRRAAHFYEALGFSPCRGDAVTHVLELEAGATASG